MPPITPPAIGPAGEAPPDDAEAAVEGAAPILVHIVTAQVLHPPPISEQTSFVAQVGHGGG